MRDASTPEPAEGEPTVPGAEPAPGSDDEGVRYRRDTQPGLAPIEVGDALEPVAAPADEDFLFHLYRGSELLMQDRFVEAKAELEQALHLQPQDAKGQDLLAGVYFRLGVYPRAIEIWRRLVEAYGRDATLRVNLALALLKTGQPADALNHLHTALHLNPDHGRAWGYLGIVLWRLGRYDEARDAFLRGGQASMARRMEEVLGTSPGELPAPEGESDEARRRAAMRSAAEEAIEQFEAELVPLSVADPSPSATPGDWNVKEPGEERIPSRRPPRTMPAASPPRLGALVDAWLVTLPTVTPVAVGISGDLHLSTTHDVYARLEGLRAVRGDLRTTPIHRRARGRELDSILGGDQPIMLWRGPVAAVIAPPEGHVFHAVSLDEDVLYVREELVWAFSDELGYESGQLPVSSTTPLDVLQLYGRGAVVLSLRGTPSAMRVGDGEEVRVAPSALLGWTGRLLPRAARPGSTEPYSVHAPPPGFPWRRRGVGRMTTGERRPRRRSIRDDAVNLPNLLTMLRIVLIPLVIWLLADATPRGNFWAAMLYIGLALTDAVDGWLARRQGLISVLGKFLDPLADKLLVMAVLVFLVHMGRLPIEGVVAVIVLLGRELSITALRTIAMSEGVVIAAGTGGKDKTALQMVAILCLILHHRYEIDFFFFQYPADLNRVGLVLLYLSVVLAVTSAGEYIKLFVDAVEAKERRLEEGKTADGRGAGPGRAREDG